MKMSREGREGGEGFFMDKNFDRSRMRKHVTTRKFYENKIGCFIGIFGSIHRRNWQRTNDVTASGFISA